MKTSPSPVRSRWPGAAACLLAAALCTAWAFMPLARPAIDASPPVHAQHAERGAEPLDLAAFSAPIWYVAPPPPAPEPAPAPRRLGPFDLELVAIVDAGGRTEAVFYDPQRDALVQVAVGQALGEGRVVDAIDGDGVTIREDAGTRTVALERGRP